MSLCDVGEMFVRLQKVRQGERVYEYMHIVEGYRDQTGKVRHRVVATWAGATG
jgi:hypothetical protein